jgi:glycosyltransferase involved in cell wall biosynthesis
VADVYDPMHLEQLEHARDAGEAGRWTAVLDTTAVLNEQLCRGDWFVCASDRQRDLWLGQLAAFGRVNPATYDDDPSLRSLIDVVPFGIEDEPPRRTGPGARGVVPGIGADDVLLLWAGGIWNWFDPVTLLRAVDVVRAEEPRVRLLFMGGRHPNAEIGEMGRAAEARAVAAQLGLLDRHVFFNDGWVPVAERQNFLLDADIGVSCHFDHVETAFSFRTRLLDYVWAGVPIVTTAGDDLGSLVAERSLGAAVPAADVEALVAALRRLVSEPRARVAARQQLAAVADELRWSTVLRPLVEFCRRPRRAPDLIDPTYGHLVGRPPTLTPRHGLRADLHRARGHLREGGVRQVAARAASRLWRGATAARDPRRDEG